MVFTVRTSVFVDTLYYVVGTHNGTLIGVFPLGYSRWVTVVGFSLGVLSFRYICLYYFCLIKCVLTNYVTHAPREQGFNNIFASLHFLVDTCMLIHVHTSRCVL